VKYADELLNILGKAVATAEDSLRAHLGGGIEQF
jgi:hypothetical protein